MAHIYQGDKLQYFLQANRERSWSSALINLLLVALCLQVLAQCLEVYLYGSPISTTFFLNLDLEDYLADYIESALCSFTLICMILFLFMRQTFLLWIPAIWSFSLAASSLIQAADIGYEFVMGAHLARILLPISLYYLLRQTDKDDKIGFGLLRLAIASTFIFHGIEALLLKPLFVDYILEGASSLFAFEMVETTAYNWLYLIGVLDILVGLGALFFRSINVFIYMAVWGLITAACRYLYHGDLGILPMLIRSAHWSIPLFLAFAYSPKPFVSFRQWRLGNFSSEPQG
jgi:hypothetical protein